jgi:hypothetical protein
MERESRVRKNPSYDGICFHTQQCAEKYLKARIASRRSMRDADAADSGRPPREPWSLCRSLCLPPLEEAVGKQIDCTVSGDLSL